MEGFADLIAPIMDPLPQMPPKRVNYLPDELLLEVLQYFPPGRESQPQLANFCLVSRQWYLVGIGRLYEAPYLSGQAYSLFVRTVCPSVIAHIKQSPLAGLVKNLDLSHIVHQSTKSTTARLLNRTKPSLRIFIAPQASFAINCWAALSKCYHLRILDLSLVSESISYEALTQTLHKLPELTAVYLPRCSSRYGNPLHGSIDQNKIWPPKLQHLQLSGSIHGSFMRDIFRKPENIPATLTSVAMSHCPGLTHLEIQAFLEATFATLKTLSLHSLPSIEAGDLNQVLDWAPNLKKLTLSAEYIDADFGAMPRAEKWPVSKPLEHLTLVSDRDEALYLTQDDPFCAIDLYALIDDRFLARLRYVTIAIAVWWQDEEESENIGSVQDAMCDMDEEHWDNRQWHYEQFSGLYEGVSWDEWAATEMGRKMTPVLRVTNHLNY